VIGIATMVVVTGVPASSRAALRAELATLGTGLLEAGAATEPPTKLPTESEAMVARIGPVEGVTAVADTHTAVSRNVNVGPSVGTPVLAGRLNLLGVLGGRTGRGSSSPRPPTACPTMVLGAEAAAGLGITTLRPGETPPLLYVAGRRFAVVGVLWPIRSPPRSTVRCWWAASAWPIRWSSRSSNAGRRSACAGRSAPTAVTSGSNSWPSRWSLPCSVLVGIVAGGYPAVRAARLMPAEALTG
jgi:putative ABC transport system permease protein